MLVLEHNDITSVDCDGTLVIWPTDYQVNKPGRIELDYGPEKVYLIPHIPHISFIKYCYTRGDYVEVWSQNKFAWAKQVVIKLGLQDYVHCARSKPTRHVDDKHELSDIVGTRIFLKYEVEEK